MRDAVLRVVFGAVVLAVGLANEPALADAVPPPPEYCPPGYIAVTSHHGPECLKKGTTNCKPGYCGERGGSRHVDAIPRGPGDGYGNDVPPADAPSAVARPPEPKEAAVSSATPTASARPAASAKAARTSKPSGGRSKGCSIASTPPSRSSSTWFVAPLLAGVALLRRRVAARRPR